MAFAAICRVDINFLARLEAFSNPALYSSISVIITESGTTIETGLKRFFRLMGKS